MLGQLELPLIGRKKYTVTGGPYLQKPSHMVGVKLAREIRAHYDVSIPVTDFSVPSKKDLDAGLERIVDLLANGQPLYVGCMGGRGRTGLVLSVLAKAFGVKHPVEYVRDTYSHHAVETEEQYEFVESYKIPAKIRCKIVALKFKSVFTLKTNLTSQSRVVPSSSAAAGN